MLGVQAEGATTVSWGWRKLPWLPPEGLCQVMLPIWPATL